MRELGLGVPESCPRLGGAAPRWYDRSAPGRRPATPVLPAAFMKMLARGFGYVCANEWATDDGAVLPDSRVRFPLRPTFRRTVRRNGASFACEMRRSTPCRCRALPRRTATVSGQNRRRMRRTPRRARGSDAERRRLRPRDHALGRSPGCFLNKWEHSGYVCSIVGRPGTTGQRTPKKKAAPSRGGFTSLDSFFQISKRGSTIGHESAAWIVTFSAMASFCRQIPGDPESKHSTTDPSPPR